VWQMMTALLTADVNILATIMKAFYCLVMKTLQHVCLVGAAQFSLI
jgi:hypothetical protein